MSPSTAFRTCPMCAALFGLMLVCSTIIFSAARVRRPLPTLRSAPRRTLPRTPPAQNTHSNTPRPPPQPSQSPRSSPTHSQSLAQSPAVPSSTASPTQSTPAKPPPPSQSSAAAPAQSPAPRHISRECAPRALRATASSVSDTRVLSEPKTHELNQASIGDAVNKGQRNPRR